MIGIVYGRILHVTMRVRFYGSDVLCCRPCHNMIRPMMCNHFGFRGCW